MNVLVIIPFFGKWPGWLDYYLQACAYNTSIHWLLIGDSQEPELLPGNIQFENMSLQDFNKLASNKLEFQIDYYNPYKICDLRPAFGIIFSDYIKDHDFWGYADLDVIFGNISSFITEDLLNNHDIISVRKNYMAGHFALYKNIPHINSMFSRADRYRQIFQDSTHHYAFDERSNLIGRKLTLTPNMAGKRWIDQRIISLKDKIRLRLNPSLQNSEYPDMTTIVSKLSEAGEIGWFHEDIVRSDLWFEKQKIRDWEIIWKNGKILDTLAKEELLHFHFIRSKNDSKFKIEGFREGAGFSIKPFGIAPVPKNG